MSLKTAVNPNAVVVSTKLSLDKLAIKQINQRAIEGLLDLGYHIASQARRNAPVKTSALRNSIRVEPDHDTVYIRAGGTVVKNKRIDYAYIREKENHLHPDKAHYMEKAEQFYMSGDQWLEFFKETV